MPLPGLPVVPAPVTAWVLSSVGGGGSDGVDVVLLVVEEYVLRPGETGMGMEDEMLGDIVHYDTV